jgi:hypothetical protein
MINRRALVTRHNPVLTSADTESPLTVGNGDFAFTADITGLQTLYDEYSIAPLCTMSSWGWHTAPNSDGKIYTFDDVEMTRYDIGGRTYEYASEIQPGNEEVYHWLRHNPHRLNLFRIGFSGEINSSDITDIRQELELYTGILRSNFKMFGDEINVTTVCAKTADIVGFRGEYGIYAKTGFGTDMRIPYGSHEKNASDWENRDKVHQETINMSQPFIFKSRIDNDEYCVAISEKRTEETFEIVLSFSKEEKDLVIWSFDEILRDSENGWREFWESGGIADFSRCTDPRAYELERRMILSMYLTAVHSAGKLPPQETGLLCNSWYGKFHLEMHILHTGWLPLWGREELLEKSLAWYESILPKARENAARNGFKGARWPKMTAPNGADSPSWIATLLIWQQPHIIYMLDLIARAKPENERLAFKKRYRKLVQLTAEFMYDFAQHGDEKGDFFCLPPPLIPAQEEHKPEVTLNPTFELCYWKFGLEIALNWGRELGEENFDWWKFCNEYSVDLPVHNGMYIAHQNCPDTFEKYNKDHPSMLFGYGFIDCDAVVSDIMWKTVDKVLACWDFKTAWGWDFALMAMTLTRLGRHEEAVNILLMNTEKNSYVTSGNNFQRGRENNDLPLYLPGNGSLLFALALMLTSGFPQNSGWEIETEGIMPPY